MCPQKCQFHFTWFCLKRWYPQIHWSAAWIIQSPSLDTASETTMTTASCGGQSQGANDGYPVTLRCQSWLGKSTMDTMVTVDPQWHWSPKNWSKKEMIFQNLTFWGSMLAFWSGLGKLSHGKTVHLAAVPKNSWSDAKTSRKTVVTRKSLEHEGTFHSSHWTKSITKPQWRPSFF